MKKDKHPEYQEVLFVDSSTSHEFLCGTTIKTKETATYEGKEYPSYRIPISSASHPFFTGSEQFVDSEGRVDKFMRRYGNKASAKKTEATEEQEQNKEQEQK
jgi:large subunit ribosomal protein L31